MSHFSVLPEMEKFQLVCKWLEEDVSKRISHQESLLSQITFNVLDKSNLHLVTNWVLDKSYMNDTHRIDPLTEVNERANSPILQTTRGRDRSRRGDIYYRNEDYNQYHDYSNHGRKDRGDGGDNGDRRDRGTDEDNVKKDPAPQHGRPRYRSQGDPQQRDQREPQRERNGADAVTA